MNFEDDTIAAWRTIDRLRLVPAHEVEPLLQALREIRDNLDEILA